MLTRNIFILLLPLVIISCNPQRDDYTFSIRGKLRNIYPGEVKLYKATDLIRQQFDIMDTVMIKGDSSFLEYYDLEPHYYALSLYDSLFVPFIADSGQQITIQITEENGYEVSGSSDTRLLEEYEDFRVSVLEQYVYPIRGKLYQLIDKNDPDDAERIEELGIQVAEAEKYYRDTLLNAVKKMGTSVAIYPTMVRWNGDEHMDFYEKLASQFVQDHPGLEISNLISEKVRIMKQVSLGGKVVELIASDTSGTDRSLYENLGKYTLIDFWGSWCAPCRAESEKLLELHEKFQELGFEIFGFAVEDDKSKWEKAIEKDQRNWVNVSTLNWYSNEICAEYGITALPRNFLIDEMGIIIAKDIHGAELEKKLTVLFSEI